VVTAVVTIGVVVVEVDVEVFKAVVVVSKDERTVELTVELVDASVLVFAVGVVISWELDVVTPSPVEEVSDLFAQKSVAIFKICFSP
jgi:hypothetical protein